jgi:hypothetical protein
MKLPAYLEALNLSAVPVDYTWDNMIGNTLWSTNDESSPRLAAAINPINARAAFALGVACCEWVLARVNGHTDTTDAVLRIEAGWAAVADVRYAQLPAPPSSPPSAPREYAGPLRLAMRLLKHAHELQMAGSVDVNSRTQALAMLVDHIVGRHPAFEPWLAESLRRCDEHYHDTGVPVAEQPPVPKPLFEPDFVWRDGAAEESLARLVQTLDPARNPYLRSADEMVAAGFPGQPYGRSRQ